MLRLAFGVIFVLHGLVHLLYFGQSRRLFEMQPGMVWPDGSWLFSPLLGDETTRLLASIACVIAALGFGAGGVGLFASQAWWRSVVAASAVFSAVVFLLFWDGAARHLDQKGGIGILIDLAILFAVLVLRWPDFDV